jgi:hypothetical protein
MPVLAIVIFPRTIRTSIIIAPWFFPVLGFHVNHYVNCVIVVVFGMLFSVLYFVYALFCFNYPKMMSLLFSRSCLLDY